VHHSQKISNFDTYSIFSYKQAKLDYKHIFQTQGYRYISQDVTQAIHKTHCSNLICLRTKLQPAVSLFTVLSTHKHTHRVLVYPESCCKRTNSWR